MIKNLPTQGGAGLTFKRAIATLPGIYKGPGFFIGRVQTSSAAAASSSAKDPARLHLASDSESMPLPAAAVAVGSPKFGPTPSTQKQGSEAQIVPVGKGKL